MSKLILSSITGAALALAAPAFATGSDETVASGSPDAAKPKAEQRYCVVYDLTGSHLRRKECKTRKDWLAEGFDPLAKQ